MRVAQVWAETFGDRLGVRLPSSHAKCDVCVRHQLVLRELTDDRLAAKAQMAQYTGHLNKQYEDRCLYWASRSLSRSMTAGSDGVQTVTVICDGMDHCKFKYPRSLNMVTKSLDGFQRPYLDMHACIVHGHMVLLALSEMWQDSNWCNELLGHVLHCTADRVDLRSIRLVVQCDNTCRELKNNGTLRWLAQLVGSMRIHSAELRCLQKGHTREDVDAVFAGIAAAIESEQELHIPSDFTQLLEKYMASARKHEPMKKVMLVDRCRDWQLGSREFNLNCFLCQLQVFQP